MPEAPSRLAERGGALLEGAAERSRTSMRTRFERLRLAWRSLVQTAAAATAAYLIATEVAGHAQPFFAPIAAIITLGITVGQRGRRAVELALGVAVGIAVADALVLLIGTGRRRARGRRAAGDGRPPIFLGSGQIFATQAAVSAVLVAVLQPAAGGFSGARFVDALIGGGVALLANALLLPADPVKIVRRAAEPVLEELAPTLRGDRRRRSRRARRRPPSARCCARARPRRARGRPAGGRRPSAARRPAISPARRRSARHRRLLRRRLGPDRPRHPQRARARPRRAARRAARARTCRRAVADAVRDLAEACLALREALADPERADAVRTPALHAAATATRVLEETGNLSVTVVVGQVRSTAVDLLRGSGLTYTEAAELVREAAREVEDAEDAAT